MVTGDEEIQWAYLIGPCFQLENTAGKPLTGGYLEVYIAGTRDKYYCASDFAGTLHPFQIPLDSLGSNIVLASPTNVYDIYVYNKFGSLVMSRYNVMCTNGSADISVTGFTSVISDGTLDVSVTGNSFIISAQELWDAVSGLVNDVQTVSSALDSVSGMLDGKKDIQVPYIASGTNVQTITKITQDEQGVMTVEYSDIQAQNPLTPGQYVNIDNDVISVTGLQPEGDYLEQGDLDGYATENWVTAYVEEHGGDDQVQSDWTQTDSEAVDYIKNKPAEKVLVAGDHIDITSTASSVEISAEGFATEDYVVDYVDSVVSGLDPVDITSSDGTIVVSSTVSGSVKVFDLSVSGGQPVYFRGGETWVPVSGTTADFSRVKKFDGTIVPSDTVSGIVPLGEGLWAWDAIVDIYVGGHVNELVKCGIKGQAVGNGYDPDSETELLIDSTRPGVINSFTLTGLSRGGSNAHLAFTFTRENSSTSTMWVRMRRLSVYQVKGPGVSQSGGGGDYEAGYGIIINNNVISVNSALIPDIDTVSGMINNATDGLASEDYVTGYVETQIDNAKEIYNVYWNMSTLSEIIQASVLDNKKVYLEVAHYDESWTDIHYEVPLTRIVTPSQAVSGWYAEFVVPYTTADNSPKGIVFKVDATNTWSQYEFGQVQADWSVTATDSVSYIQNKPDLSGFVNESYVTGYVESQVSGLQPAGDYLVSGDLEGYATEGYVTAYVDSHVTGGGGNQFFTEAMYKSADDSLHSIIPGMAIDYNKTYNQTFNGIILEYANYSGVPIFGRLKDKHLMKFADKSRQINIVLDYYASVSIYPVWLPCTSNSSGTLTPINTSVYLKYKNTVTFAYTSAGINPYQSNGTRRSFSYKYAATINTPFTYGKNFDDSIFEKVGDWSNITDVSPECWVLAFRNSDNTGWDYMTATTSESSSGMCVRFPYNMFDVKVWTGLDINPAKGIYVTNPVPSAASSDNGKVLGVTDTSGSIGWVEAGGGTEYTAGNYIDITNDVISVTGLQPAGDYLVSGDLAGYATEDYVTAYVDSHVTGGGSSTVYVDTHTGLKGDGSQSDPIAINYDTNTLSTAQGTETVTFTSGAGGFATIPGNSAMTTYMSTHMVTVTFQGITPVSQYRSPVKLTLSPADGQGGDLYLNVSSNIAANDTTCVVMFDVRNDILDWSPGTWNATKDWNLWLYFDDEATYPQIPYGYATSQAPSDNYKLTVKEPIPSHSYADSNKVLTVNSSNNTLYWNTVKTLPAHSYSDVGKVLTAGSNASTETWKEIEIVVANGSPIIGKGSTGDPLDLSIDNATLAVSGITDNNLPMVGGHAQIYANTTLSQYVASNNITFTITGITPTASSRTVSFSFTGGSTGSKSCFPEVISGGTIPANASSFSVTVNARNYAEWGYPYSSAYDWHIYISEEDGATWPAIPYTGCSHNGPATSSNVLAVKNPVPSSTSSDENKVLTVNSSGTPEWQPAQGGGTTYTAGNMISLANDAIAVSTTAGITDIQTVASLPANPVSTVLYLIPEV